MEVLLALLPWLLILAFWVGVIGGGGYLLVRFVRAYERRSGIGASEASVLQERVRSLEETIERMETELVQLAEAQRFTTHLLSGQKSEDPHA